MASPVIALVGVVRFSLWIAELLGQAGLRGARRSVRSLVRRTLRCAQTAWVLWSLSIRLLTLIGLHSWRWVIFVARLVTFAVLLFPAWVVVVPYYTHSSNIKTVLYGPHRRNDADVYAPEEGVVLCTCAAAATVSHDGGVRCTCDPAKRPVLLCFAGGAWTIGNKMWTFAMCRSLTRAGVVAVSCDYRNFPQTSMSGMLEDVDAALEAALGPVQEHGGSAGAGADRAAAAGSASPLLEGCDPSAPHAPARPGGPPYPLRQAILDAGGDLDRVFAWGQSAGAHLLVATLVERAICATLGQRMQQAQGQGQPPCTEATGAQAEAGPESVSADCLSDLCDGRVATADSGAYSPPSLLHRRRVASCANGWTPESPLRPAMRAGRIAANRRETWDGLGMGSSPLSAAERRVSGSFSAPRLRLARMHAVEEDSDGGSDNAHSGRGGSDTDTAYESVLRDEGRWDQEFGPLGRALLGMPPHAPLTCDTGTTMDHTNACDAPRYGDELSPPPLLSPVAHQEDACASPPSSPDEAAARAGRGGSLCGGPSPARKHTATHTSLAPLPRLRRGRTLSQLDLYLAGGAEVAAYPSAGRIAYAALPQEGQECLAQHQPTQSEADVTNDDTGAAESPSLPAALPRPHRCIRRVFAVSGPYDLDQQGAAIARKAGFLPSFFSTLFEGSSDRYSPTWWLARCAQAYRAMEEGDAAAARALPRQASAGQQEGSPVIHQAGAAAMPARTPSPPQSPLMAAWSARTGIGLPFAEAGRHESSTGTGDASPVSFPPLNPAHLPPVSLYHGTADTTVPHCVSLQLRDALVAAGRADTTLMLLPGGGHTAPILEDPLGGHDPLLRDVLSSMRADIMMGQAEAVEPLSTETHPRSRPRPRPVSLKRLGGEEALVPALMLSWARWINPF